jgi:hypothetical protein
VIIEGDARTGGVDRKVRGGAADPGGRVELNPEYARIARMRCAL